MKTRTKTRIKEFVIACAIVAVGYFIVCLAAIIQ